MMPLRFTCPFYSAHSRDPGIVTLSREMTNSGLGDTLHAMVFLLLMMAPMVLAVWTIVCVKPGNEWLD